ncbi:hypothetical protein Gotur_031014 [Gossypium turneri]
MQCALKFACSAAPPSSASIAPLLFSNTHNKKKKLRNGCSIRAELSDDNDPLLQAAINSASLHPLFIDPYAGCFVSTHTQMDMETKAKQYCIATKFIDDKLLSTVNHMDGLKQVVLLSDGMDTRPYRLNWPSSTIMFDISPLRVFQKAAEKLDGVGAKIPQRCLFLHVPLETPNIQETLVTKGFNGTRPSVWAIQGLPLMTLVSFEEILLTVSGMAMKGCLFFGELPAWLAETGIGNKSSMKKWINNIFMSYGFKVDMISYNEVAKRLGKVVKPGDYEKILFVAEQLRCSDDEMETWRKELQRVDEDGDEEGFEDL